jgi:DNA-binding LacI/PurR family transcriptional regulator/serine phosphatase RsbU (regulator of sigma subunit)
MTRTSRRIGLLVDWLEDEYQDKVLAGVDAEAQANGVGLLCIAGGVLRSPFRFGARRNFIYDLVGQDCIDGLVIMSGTLGNYIGPSKLARYCERYRPLPMCSIGVALQGIPSVLVDNAKGMRDAMLHLIDSHGYRRIAFIRGPGVNEEAEERYRVYREVLGEHGLPFNPDLVTLGNFQASSGAEAVRQMYDERHVAFDAIVAANDFMAIGVMDALQARGIRVPQDVAVVGFDDIREGRFAPTPLTTVRQPLDRQGKQALELVLAQIDGQTIDENIILHTELVRRQSCGCSSHELPDRPVPEFRLDESDVGVVFSEHKARILADVTQAIWTSSPDVDVSIGVELVEAFKNSLPPGSVNTFIGTLEAAVQVAAESGGNVDAWQAVVTTLRRFTLAATVNSPDLRQHAEELCHEARVLVGSAAERTQARKRLEVEHWSRLLRKAGEALYTSLDVAAVMHTVQEQIPRLGIKSAYLSMFESGQENSRFSLAYDSTGRGVEKRRGEIFPSSHLVPEGVFDDNERQTFIVEPLFFEHDQLGFVLFELGPTHGVVYETLRDQISSALKGALLVQQLVEETTRRELAERDRLQKEMEIAERIQTSILPKNLQAEGLEIAAVMLPAADVGGDYYDVLPFEGGCWLAIGDVAGHGLRTGLIMMMLQSIVSALVRHNIWASPRDLLRTVNAVIYENIRRRLGQDEHATLTLFRLDAQGRLVFAGAHEDIIIYRARDRRLEVIPTPGTWVGAVRSIDAGTVESEQHLQTGDVVLLYTDGLTEAMDENQQVFGIDRLSAEFGKVAESSVGAIRDHILSTVRQFAASQDDDMTLLVVRYTG